MNEFLLALTSLFVRPHSSPVSRATETSHRVQGRGQEEDKRRTRPGHRAQPQSSGAQPRQGQEEDKAQPQSPAQRTRGGQEPSKPSIAHERARSRPALFLSFFLSFFLSLSLSLPLCLSLSLSLPLSLSLSLKCIFLRLSLCRARSERAFLERMSERARHTAQPQS